MLKLLRPSPERQLAAAKAVLAHLAEVLDSRISVQLWDGSRVPLGQNVHPHLFVAIRGPGVIGSLLRWPTLDNLVRHYASGQIEVHGDDLIEFFKAARVERSRERLKVLRTGTLLRNALPFLLTPAEQVRPQHEFAGDQVGRATSSRNNRDYIQFHYDVGNEFYQLFLDGEMQYSCGYFTSWSNSLEQAQRDKMDMICRKLRLAPGERLLDIGCGWGGLLCHAAQHYGVCAHGVTLSQAQFDFARQKIQRLGLENQVQVELRDYATLEGKYDKIASIGMYEHVGIANYGAYFGKINSLLRDRGILLNHGITRPAKAGKRGFARIRPEQRLILKYIFPGGELDHIGHTCESLELSRFEVHDVEDWREHYAQTTRLWCQRLTARRDEAMALVGPERYRLWLAYLAGVSIAFHDGSARIYQVVASKHAARGRAELPATRADLYRPAA
ncbi:MAG TPA: cyclopropane-fatty-acyl-phospholipid synthase family protein [Pirellulaceae bacterium]|nr:cyclopropane-fatty-acyl-phospholipid synthase family protein [Pirellulaceae bacterium]